jgi:hypothetical protein
MRSRADRPAITLEKSAERAQAEADELRDLISGIAARLASTPAE